MLGFAFVACAVAVARYSNPVLRADLPDPSIMRVGKDYFGVATTSEWLPAFQIFHSTDLVNWAIVGSVFDAKPAWAVGSFWAPEWFQLGNGTFMVVYTARKINGPLCVAVATAASPLGPFTDRGPMVCEAIGSIDGCAVREEATGELFLVWKRDGNSQNQPTPILAQQIDTSAWQMVGNVTELFRNDPSTWEENLIEGPFVIFDRKRAVYNLFYSAHNCCGRGCDYSLGVAQATSLLGPWTKNPQNPILAANGDAECPGHGTVVLTASGRAFLMYHAYVPGTTVYTGRQVMIDEVVFTRSWPTINSGRGPTHNTTAPMGVAGASREMAFVDTFAGSSLLPGWLYPNGMQPRVSVANSTLALGADPNFGGSSFVNGMVGRYIATGDYVATALVPVAGVPAGVTAALAAVGAPDAAIGVGVQNGANGAAVVVWRLEQNNWWLQASAPVPAGVTSVFARLRVTNGVFYSAEWSVDDSIYTPLGWQQNGDFLSQWDRGSRIGVVVGGGSKSAAVQFDTFAVFFS